MSVINLNEVDNQLNEREQSLKKKIFKLGKMEALVFADPKLSAIYDDMSINGEERYGYHYNETIMNIIFNDYVLNSPKFLQKYKMAVAKKKNRRDKSGIEKLKNDADKAGKVPKKEVVEEETSAGSAGGDAGYTGFAGPSAWSKNGDLLGNSAVKPINKPIFPQGTVVAESYLTNPDLFGEMIKALNESIDRESEIAHISKNTDEYGNEIKNMSNSDVKIINQDINNRKLDEDYSLRNPVAMQVIGWVNIPSYKYGGASLFNVGDNDTFGKQIGAAYQLGSPYNEQFNLVPQGDNNYIIQDNPRFWSKYIKVDDEKNKLYFYDEDNKWKFLGNFKGMDINPSKAWSGNSDNERFFQKIEDLKKSGATFKFNDESIFDDKQDDMNETSMIDDNPQSMSVKAGNGGGMDTGMNAGGEMDAGMNTGGMNEGGRILDDPKVTKLVAIVNQLIGMAKDPAGDPIGVVDSQSTWQEPYIYLPIEYKNGQLKITSHSVYSSKPNVEVILNRNMEYDGIPTLRQLAMQYKKAIKQNQNNYQKDMDKYNNDDDKYNNDRDMNENEIFNEINEELKIFADLQTKLKGISEDRKTSSLINVDRMGSDNQKNFKQDLQHSGTKEIINIEKELQYKDQQTNIKDPKKLSSDIEKEELKKTHGEALKNVGNSANEKGDEIPKRNLEEEEQEEVNNYRLGLGDYKFDGEVGKKFEDRMKADMGEDNYKARLAKLEIRKNQPMYNKDTQPTNTVKVNESFVSGKYFDQMGVSHIIDFTLSEAVESKTIDAAWFKLDLNGLGNTYTNKLDTDTHKIGINEGVSDMIDQFNYFIDVNKTVFVSKIANSLNENASTTKTKVNEGFDKMKHLFEYNGSDFVNMKNNKKI